MIAKYTSCISLSDKDKYPYNETIMFFTGDSGKQSVGDYPNAINYTEALSIDSDAPLYRKLLPITSLETLTNRSEILLQGVDFVGYDTAGLNIQQQPAEKQAWDEQTRGNAISAIWQPNFFRPKIKIGDEDVTSGIYNTTVESTFYDLTIGLPMPFCLSVNKIVKNPINVEVVAAFAQPFYNGTGELKFRNYPIQAIMYFWHNNK